MSVIIKALKPELIDDFFFFFDKVAFTDNPDWAKCYCHFYHFEGTPEHFQETTAEQNRNASKNMILSNNMHGFLAYKDEKPIAWCNVNMKEKFSQSMLGERIVNASDGKIASIVCFLVAPGYRRQGLARSLLQAACSEYKSIKSTIIEAYPRKGDQTEAMHYHGPLSLYISEGFSIHEEFEDFYIVRKVLN